MRKVIPTILLLVLLASSAHAFSSPPRLLEKLDAMFEWTKGEMDTPEAKRPPVFISSPRIFLDICKRNTVEENNYDCEDTIGLYYVESQTIHISDHRYPSMVDGTIIHEMVHYLQHLVYKLPFLMNDANDKFIEDQADKIGREYVRQKYGIVTR